MSVITQAGINPVRWQVDEHILVDGDVLEIERGAEWSGVRVAYHPLLREQRFFPCGDNDRSIPIIEGTRARLIMTVSEKPPLSPCS